MRMPWKAVSRCGVLWSQSKNERLLWQKVQLTPSYWEMFIMNP